MVCEFAFCFPLPVITSQSSGPHSIMTDEAFTERHLAISESRQLQYDRLASSRYERYSSTLSKHSFRLLEIGCGSCELGNKYQELGVDYHGIDLDDRMVEAARRSGVRNVRQVDFFDLPEGEPFHVITFSQVLEHIKEPRPFLAKVHKMLHSGGIVHCDVPNHGSLPSLLYRLPLKSERCGAIEYPWHLFAYNKRSIHRLFQDFFSVEVFDATVTDPIFGQAAEVDNVLTRLDPILKLLRAGSLLVAYGIRKTNFAY
jgi:SAM-dependent methyltransferase